MRGQEDVHPGVNLQALGPGPGQQPGERVEVARLPLEQRAAGDEGGAVESVATPAHLHEERVHSRRGGVVHRLVDRLRRDERGAHHPQAAHLRGRGGRRPSPPPGRAGREPGLRARTPSASRRMLPAAAWAGKRNFPQPNSLRYDHGRDTMRAALLLTLLALLAPAPPATAAADADLARSLVRRVEERHGRIGRPRRPLHAELPLGNARARGRRAGRGFDQEAGPDALGVQGPRSEAVRLRRPDVLLLRPRRPAGRGQRAGRRALARGTPALGPGRHPGGVRRLARGAARRGGPAGQARAPARAARRGAGVPGRRALGAHPLDPPRGRAGQPHALPLRERAGEHRPARQALPIRRPGRGRGGRG